MELKPCPFCGEDAAILDGKSDSCRVRCESCGTEGRPSFFNGDDQDAIDIAEDEARYGWNTRSTPKQGVAGKTAKERFDQFGATEDCDPLERLRFFCSLAMSAQDWLDVEPFFAALSTPQQVEPGWVRVPVEPTQEMCQAGQWKANQWPKFPLRISPIYQAMLEAAPKEPKP